MDINKRESDLVLNAKEARCLIPYSMDRIRWAPDLCTVEPPPVEYE